MQWVIGSLGAQAGICQRRLSGPTTYVHLAVIDGCPDAPIADTGNNKSQTLTTASEQVRGCTKGATSDSHPSPP
jgi:hypothetical protein